jgi:hypothetical protein
MSFIRTESDIFHEVLEERSRQEKRWGGPSHDDTHNYHDWANFIIAQISKDKFSFKSPEEFERRMINIAALAFAAIESNQRKNNI